MGCIIVGAKSALGTVEGEDLPGLPVAGLVSLVSLLHWVQCSIHSLFSFFFGVDFYRGQAPCWRGPGGWNPVGWNPGGRNPGEGGSPRILSAARVYLVPVDLFPPSALGVLPCSAALSLSFSGDSDCAAWAVYLQPRSIQRIAPDDCGPHGP